VTTGALNLLGVAVLAGSATQRITGLGFALVASPFLVLIANPRQGVLLANMLSLITNLVVLAMVWREVNVRRALSLAVPALLLVPVGAFVSTRVSNRALYIGIGVLVLVALAATVASRRLHVHPGTATTVAAGAASGFMNVTAGVGGPAITIYAVATRWEHTEFVATVQLYFALLNAGSLIAKGGLPKVGSVALLVALTALAAGTFLGQRLNRRVPVHRARQAVLILAVAGGVATVIKGLT